MGGGGVKHALLAQGMALGRPGPDSVCDSSCFI